MKKWISYTLISLLTLSACSHHPQSIPSHRPYNERSPVSVKPRNCHEAMATLLSPDLKLWSSICSSYEEALQYSHAFTGLGPSADEIALIGRYHNSLPSSKEEMTTLRRALLFSRTLKKEEDTTEFWADFAKHNERTTPTNRDLRRFLKEQNYLKKYEAKASKLIAKKNNSHKKLMLHSHMRIFEKNYFKCLAGSTDPSMLTPKLIRQTNKVALAVTVGGMGSAMITYAASNYDLPKDKKWWFEIFYVIVTSMAMSYVNTKFILANPKLSPWLQRLPLALGASAIEDIGVSALYTQLVGIPDEELTLQLEKLESDEDFKKTLTDAFAYISQSKNYAKYEKQAKDFISAVSPDGTTTKLSQLDLKLVSWDQVDPQLTKDLFIEALSAYEYEQNKGAMNFGGEGTDRYAFHRLIDLVYQPSFLIAAMLMHKQLCRALNPTLGMVQAVTTFMAINLASDALYFFSRRALINQ